MLNIAICDDDDLIAHQIESVLHNISDEENVKIDTDVFYSGNNLVREISSGKKFDLIYIWIFRWKMEMESLRRKTFVKKMKM